MIKSLYIRVVLTFLFSVVGGAVIAFFVATWIYEDQLNDNLRVTLMDFGQDVSRIYDLLPVREADSYVSGMKQLNSFYVRIYDRKGQLQIFSAIDGHDPLHVTAGQIADVLKGEVVQTRTDGIDPILIGLPLKTEIGTKAMFVEQRAPSSTTFIIKWVLNFLMYSLIAGSLLILVAAMYLIRPIKKLTQATRQIAAGDFSVKLNIKQSGELGTLARSFEQMMRELQQLEQMRREFVSNVSHEVQSPLTSISGYALALQQADITDDERSRYLQIIMAEAERISKMSDSLLKLSVLESQPQLQQRVKFILDEQLRRVIVALQPQWSARNITFELDLIPALLTADYDQLNQVWTNIIGNSIKFTPDGGVITVSILQENGDVTVRISDTGIGISQEDQQRIFERFFKADRSHSRQYGGSGMGLAIVKQIVLLHQGSIRVESEPGRGTVIIVTLPLIG
ncbi:Adaptive-response sensory-kinase SasA [Paenibacillus auburnensis]|uniref:Heme sensor protein HssS n=1 Tax=Paenibacillus auburnensis TaxID=2905649 RepID=A0ABM9BRL8_9BACL|nr:HAMP domain-containing sensor histidine kinase [Paenibacillus auburnensis]CAH1192991.1 Adaptive-response sensory-kinase SasA [Paenibacillus auburnensis]